MLKPIPNQLEMTNPNFIFLIGFMGSGKTTIGKIIAKQTGYDFIDSDKWIENKEGKKIHDIFTTKGEAYFRKLEMNFLKSLKQLEGDYVIATGGGMPCHQYRLNRMLKLGKLVHLKIDAKSAINRLKDSKEDRPLLKELNQEELENKVQFLLQKRQKYYSQAHITVSSLEAKRVDFRGLLS